ncbi:thioredoxin family protein [Marivivens aquimaris]|uniref:thioredoxin family protein n=1 Tax=Marivivens aquimaris TaxID=2774876 RepID=UPI001880F49C|nr:thioredoxin family protein [Marivivens aquimaris]
MRKLLTLLAACLWTSVASAATLGDDGLHKETWMRETFKDLREDLEEATAEGKRLLVMVEQRGCIYCTKMHEEVFPNETIAQYIEDNYFVVQINMFGDVEVTDFDGTTLPEKEMVQNWGILFTPTLIFYPKEVEDGVAGMDAAAAVMPGAFGKWTTYNLLRWVVDEGYLGDENFQKYHARMIEEGGLSD